VARRRAMWSPGRHARACARSRSILVAIGARARAPASSKLRTTNRSAVLAKHGFTLAILKHTCAHNRDRPSPDHFTAQFVKVVGPDGCRAHHLVDTCVDSGARPCILCAVLDLIA
jgi:hypothetical protein